MLYLFHYTAMSFQFAQSYVTKNKICTRPGVILITQLFEQLDLTLSFKFRCIYIHMFRLKVREGTLRWEAEEKKRKQGFVNFILLEKSQPSKNIFKCWNEQIFITTTSSLITVQHKDIQALWKSMHV